MLILFLLHFFFSSSSLQVTWLLQYSTVLLQYWVEVLDFVVGFFFSELFAEHSTEFTVLIFHTLLIK